MKDGNLKLGLSCRFYPWYCLDTRGYLCSLRLLLFNSFSLRPQFALYYYPSKSLCPAKIVKRGNEGQNHE